MKISNLLKSIKKTRQIEGIFARFSLTNFFVFSDFLNFLQRLVGTHSMYFFDKNGNFGIVCSSDFSLR